MYPAVQTSKNAAHSLWEYQISSTGCNYYILHLVRCSLDGVTIISMAGTARQDFHAGGVALARVIVVTRGRWDGEG